MDMKQTTIAEDISTNPDDSSEDPYCLEPGFEVSPEELRRDRLAHFLLMGLRLVMEAEQKG